MWEAWCLISILGIWPRHIEPRLLRSTKLSLPIPNLHPDLEGLRVLHFSDLHFGASSRKNFLGKLSKRINRLEPDLLLFSGDFISHGKLQEKKQLQAFLKSIQAPFGAYCCLGNHDYNEHVTINADGVYDTHREANSPLILQGFSKLLAGSPKLKGIISKEAKNVAHNKDLLELLKDSPFELLENETRLIKIKDAHLNISGLGDYWLGRFDPEKAFQGYQEDHPGLVLTHNPDTFSSLKNFPGSLVLAGHSHGGQVNLPFLCKRLSPLENPQYKRGLIKESGKTMYVNRGAGSHLSFRWFAPPEILLLTLESKEERKHEHGNRLKQADGQRKEDGQEPGESKREETSQDRLTSQEQTTNQNQMQKKTFSKNTGGIS